MLDGRCHDILKYASTCHFWKNHNASRLKTAQYLVLKTSLKSSSVLCGFFREETFGDHAQASSSMVFHCRLLAIVKEAKSQNNESDQSISVIRMTANSQ